MSLEKSEVRSVGDYQRLNVLNQKNIMSDDAITEVANMINSHSVNRGQRRRLEKALNKTKNIYAHAQEKVNNNAYIEYQKAVDKNFLHFFAALSLTMGEDYRWREDDSHDQISSLLERLGNTMERYSNMGYATEDLVELVDEKYGIILIPEKER